MAKTGEPLDQDLTSAGFDEYIERKLPPSDKLEKRTGFSYEELQDLMGRGRNLSFSSTIAFSATDEDTVAWTSGAINFPDGTSFNNISSGNTGNISARTYIFFNTNSNAELQTTTSASDAVEDDGVLLAIAINNSDSNGKAEIITFGSSGAYPSVVSTTHLEEGVMTVPLVMTPSSDTTALVSVNENNGSNLFTIDSTNKRIGIGQGESSPAVPVDISTGSNTDGVRIRGALEPASDTGAQFPDTQSQIDGSWNNLANVEVEDSVDASSAVDDSTAEFTDFGFTGISGTIVGIELTIVASTNNSSSPTNTIDNIILSWDGGSSWTSAKTLGSNLTLSNVTYTVGGPADTWGRSWSASEFSDANFALRLDNLRTLGLGSTLIDYIGITVYHGGKVPSTTEIADLYVGSTGNLILDLTPGNTTSQFLDIRSEDDEYGMVLRESDGTGTSVYANFYVVDGSPDYLSINVTGTTDTDALNITSGDNVGIGIVPSTAKLEVAGNVIIGDGTAGTDYTLTFNGETNDGVLTWMEDEDYFRFSDDILMLNQEAIYFDSTDTYIAANTDDPEDLVIAADQDILMQPDGEVNIASNLSISGTSNELRLYEGANYVGFEAPDLSADQIWVLPNADGSANEIIETDGNGNLSWISNEKSESITIASPGSSEDVSMFFTNKAITVTEMRAVLLGSSTPSVTWTVRHDATDRSATGSEVVTSGTTTTSTTSGSDVTSFNNEVISADSFVWVETTAQSGTVNELHLTLFYKRFSSAYTFQASITIDNTKVSGTSDLTDFPLLVQGTYDGTGGEPDLRTTGNGGNIQNTDASGGITGGLTVPADLAFFSDSSLSSQLDHEFESYNASTGEISVWVRIPTLSYNSDTTIYMGYGSSTTTTSQENINAVWANYDRVFHLTDLTTSTVADSTGNQNGTKASANNPAETTGYIGDGQDFDATSDAIESTASSPSAYTESAWVNLDDTTNGRHLVSQTDGSTSNNTRILVVNSGTPIWRAAAYDGSNHTVDSSVEATTSWQYVVATGADSDNIRIYVDGDKVGTSVDTLGTISSLTDRWAIGGSGSLDAPNGIIDEVRFSSTKFTDDYIKTDYNTQSDPSTFYTMGSET